MRRILAASVVVLALAGCGHPTDPAPAAAPPVVVSSSAAPTVADPVGIELPSVGASGRVLPVALDPDGSIQEPDVHRPELGGWYTEGPRPGEVGPAVVIAHVDGDHKPGLFYRLHELTPGAEVRVTRADGSVAVFVVDRVERHPKSAFPTAAVYGDVPGAELRLITCGGVFDRQARNYLDNWIVWAHLVDASP